MGFLEKVGLKAKKEPSVQDIKKDKSQYGASANPANVEPPHDDFFKAYIPNFLYKPPFGYPLNKNVLHLKQLARNPYIFSIIRTLKDEASTTKWEITIKKEYANDPQNFAGEYDEQIKTVSNWFYNPNGNEESFNDIVGQWIQDLCEVDAAVGIKVFNGEGKFSQLFARDGGSFLKNPDIYGYLGNREEFVTAFSEPRAVANQNLIMPDRIKVYDAQYSTQAAYFQYGWTGNALPVPFGRRELIYIMANPRSDSIYGRAPLEVIEDVLLTLIYGAKYNMEYYLNGNMPDGLVHLEGADREICNSFQERLKDKFTKTDETLGYQRRMGHNYPVWGGPGANFVPFQISAKDMEIIEQQKWFTKLVWSAFGVTPDQMGYTEDSNKAVSQTQTGVFKKKALKPMLRKIEYAINTQLMPELDPSGMLEFHFEDYDLDEDIKRMALYESQIRMGIKTAEMVASEEGINLQELEVFKVKAQEQQAEQMQQQFDMTGGAQNNPQEKKPFVKAIPDNWIAWGKKQIPKGFVAQKGPRGGTYIVKQGGSGGKPADASSDEKKTQEQNTDEKKTTDKTSDKMPVEDKTPKEERTVVTEKEMKILSKFNRAEPGKGEEIKFESEEEAKIVLDKGHYALISGGKSPYDNKMISDEQIQKRSQELEKELIKRGYKFTKVLGKYGAEEDSFLVMTHNPDEKDMIELGEKFNQESVIIVNNKHNKLLYTNGPDKGKVSEGDGYEALDKEQKDYFTQLFLKKGTFKYTLNINFDEKKEPGVKSELSQGIKIESEHKDVIDFIKKYYEKHGEWPPDEDVFKKIAQDHLDEFKNYYSELKKMEADLKKPKAKADDAPKIDSKDHDLVNYFKDIKKEIMTRMDRE